MPIQFPKNFYWGSATSSYQVEGHNANSDWYPWELKVGHQPSANACEHYERYEQDFDLARGLHHNAHRLSIEWSRVEPREGEFAHEVLQHYVDVIKALRARGIEPMVTLHHFTNPIWLSDQGGWVNQRSVKLFTRYCKEVTRALAPYVRFWITINEPTIYISHSFIWGWWPPQIKNYFKAKMVCDHMNAGHIQAYGVMNKVYQELGLEKPMISISQHCAAIVPCTPTLRNRWAAALRDQLFNFDILDHLMKAGTLDYIGLNYYSRMQVDVSSWWIGNMLSETCKHKHDPMTKNFLGWDIYPEGLCLVLKKLHARYKIPIFITENGICTLDDSQRWKFIDAHLRSIHQAMAEGVDVQGYLYWSLLDNFEWDKGYKPRFGLIDVNYETQERTVRESAKKFGHVCQTGILE